MEHVPTSFVAGTPIETARGAVAIEELRSGDLVLGPGGQTQRVRQVGLLALSPAALAERPDHAPVRIRAGALGCDQAGAALPLQDLLVAPTTTLLVPRTGIGVPAWVLVNGRSILPEPASGTVLYYQVERETSAPLLAAGAMADVATEPAPSLRMLRVRASLARLAGAPPGRLEGRIDRCDHGAVSGWARDMQNPEVTVALAVVIDGEPAGCILARGARADLATAGKGDCAFRWRFEPKLPHDRQHLIRLYRIDDLAPMPDADILLDAPPALEHVLALLGADQADAARAIIAPR